MRRREEKELEEDFDDINLKKTRAKVVLRKHRSTRESTSQKSMRKRSMSKQSQGKFKLGHAQSPLIDFTECNSTLSKIMTLSLAIKCKLFDVLDKSGNEMTADEIKDIISPNVHRRHLISILDKLHFHNYLDKSGTSPNAKYTNSDYTKKYFLSESEKSYTAIYKNIDRYLKRFQLLDDKMQDGKFDNLIIDLYKSEEETRIFLDYFITVNQKNFQNLLEIFDFGKYEIVLDASGKNGFFASMVKSKYQNLQVSSFDHPMLEDFAREYLKSKNMSDDVKLLFGFILEAEIPECDVIIVPHVLQFFYEDDKKEILEKMYKSLREGGSVIILENFLYEPKYPSETSASKVSLLLTLEGYQGYNCTFDEFKEILENIGFKDVQHVKKIGLSDLIFAKK